MNKTKTSQHTTLVDHPLDPEVVAFRRQFDDRSPLDELVREGARRMLQAAINAEVETFIVRLKEQWSTEYESWCQRDLTGKQYVYVWADGIHVKVRLEDDANKKQCILVLMGATADGKKELIAVLDGYRESEQSWHELLLSLKQRGLARMALSSCSLHAD